MNLIEETTRLMGQPLRSDNVRALLDACTQWNR